MVKWQELHIQTLSWQCGRVVKSTSHSSPWLWRRVAGSNPFHARTHVGHVGYCLHFTYTKWQHADVPVTVRFWRCTISPGWCSTQQPHDDTDFREKSLSYGCQQKYPHGSQRWHWPQGENPQLWLPAEIPTWQPDFQTWESERERERERERDPYSALFYWAAYFFEI